MIGGLLKQLIVGLWRFFSYHLVRVTGFGIRPALPQPSASLDPTGSKPAETSTQLSYAQILTEPYLRPMRLTTSRQDLDSEDILSNPVFDLWKSHKPRAHKWSHYFEPYEAVFGPYRSRARRILEIGVYKGASLSLWRRYFSNPDTIIIGIDIDPNCAQFDSPHENVHVRIGSQTDGHFLAAVTREFGPFDIIIDDGSHVCSHMFASFNHLFADALTDEGIYLAEDLHANYWAPYRDTPQSYLDFCKQLMDFMHAHYTQAGLGSWLQESESKSGSEDFYLDLPAIATMVKEIRVFDSIVAIYKTRRKFLPRVLNPSAD